MKTSKKNKQFDRNIFALLLVYITTTLLLISSLIVMNYKLDILSSRVYAMTNQKWSTPLHNPIDGSSMLQPLPFEPDKEVIEPEEQGYSYSKKEIEMIARVTMAEVGTEPEKTKRLVIDTILNRVENPRFANTVKKVIYAKNQFSVMTNGAYKRAWVDDKYVQLVEEEIDLENRLSNEVLYFRTSHYHDFGIPVTSVRNCYFSGLASKDYRE